MTRSLDSRSRSRKGPYSHGVKLARRRLAPVMPAQVVLARALLVAPLLAPVSLVTLASPSLAAPPTAAAEPTASADDARRPAGVEPGAEPAAEAEEAAPAPLPRDIDHFLTGFPLRGAHVAVSCESCHARGILEGTPRQCELCHTNAGPVRASPKPLDHIVTRADCDRCHTESSWLGARFVHTADTTTRCFACHNGRSAEGKNREHIPSPNTCQDCHGTRTFKLF